MSRFTPVDPANATGRAKEIFDGPLKGKAFNIFRAMSNSPAALDAYVSLSGALSRGSLDAKAREVIQLAIGQATGCDYCVAAHTAIGRGAGLTDEQTMGARRGSVADPRLNAIIKFALNLHEKRGFVSDADLAAFRQAGCTDAHAAEVIANYALAIYTNYFNHANHTPVDFPAAPPV